MWTATELAPVAGRAVLLVGFLSYFFYRSIWVTIPMSFIGILYFQMCTEKRIKNSQNQLTIQFKECILSVAAALKAGYAVENAFLESREDMKMLYGPDSYIYQELEVIRRGFVINITLEELLNDLASRSGSEEITQFATVFSIAKRSGGNLPEIIRTSAELIGQKIEARQELETLLSGRQMEQNIMRLMPFAVLGYIGISYPGYFDMLYHNWTGVAIMTGCLVMYLSAYVLGEKIIQRIYGEIM